MKFLKCNSMYFFLHWQQQEFNLKCHTYYKTIPNELSIYQSNLYMLNIYN